MKYLIHSGDKYLATFCGKDVTTKDKAYKWATKSAAEKVVMMTKMWGPIYKAMEFVVEEVKEDGDEAPVTDLISEATFNDGTLKKLEEKINTVNNTIQILHNIASDLEGRKDTLESELREFEMYTQDILHFIEFNPRLSVVNGWKVYKLLHRVRIGRRQVKDELAVIEAVLNAPITAESLAKVNNDLGKLEDRVYKPRIAKELFSLVNKKGA